MGDFRIDTRASRGILLIISIVVIWYTILFRQNRTDRPSARTRLLDLFVTLRVVKKEPQAILEFQHKICGDIITLQFLKTDLRDIDTSVTKFADHMRLTVMHLLDALVWRLLDYDRTTVQILADHKPTGHLDDTFLDDLAKAEQITREEHAIVLVNDLTNVLRYGDLTIFKDGKPFPLENKSGKASADSRRATRQRLALQGLQRFLALGIRDTDYSRDYIFAPQLSPKTYHTVVAQAIGEARKKGYYQLQLSDCLAIEVLWPKCGDADIPQGRPFSQEEYILPVDNLSIADIPVTKIAPYGIFPFDDEVCFGLLTGELVIRSVLNLRRLQKKYQQVGLRLELPQPTKDEIRAYVSAPIADRRKQLNRLALSIEDSRNNGMSADLNYLWPIVFEFWQEESLIEAQRQLLKFMGDMHFSDDKATRFYIGYGNEGSIWTNL